MSPHIAEIIGNLKANAMSITKKSKNLRRRVKNAFWGPKNGPKSLKFFQNFIDLQSWIFQSKKYSKKPNKKTQMGMSLDRAIFFIWFSNWGLTVNLELWFWIYLKRWEILFLCCITTNKEWLTQNKNKNQWNFKKWQFKAILWYPWSSIIDEFWFI